ncbi:MAG: copper resistance protein CopC [Steroidobacteraceae bacterium]
MKKYLSYLSALVLSVTMFTGAVQAHSHLHSSNPADNSKLETAPKNLQLEFSEAVKLTALTVQKGDAAAQELSPLPAAAAKQISVAMPVLTAGSYIVKWRALSADNHVASGKFVFTLTK